MTSSSSFELRVEVEGEVIGRATADRLAPRDTSAGHSTIAPGARVEVVIVRRGGWSNYRGSLSIGGQLTASIAPHREETRLRIGAFREEYGETSVVYEDRGPGRARLEVLVDVEGEPATRALYEQLFESLEALHVGLAQDVLSRTQHRRGRARTGTSALRPTQEVERLEALVAELAGALAVIGRQPSQALERRVRHGRYRPGDRVRPGAIGQILTAAGTQVHGGRIRSLGLVPALRTRLSTDIGEHRQIRSGLERLAARARGVARHCRRAAEAFEPERARWGGRRDHGTTVFEQKYVPRIRALETMASRAEAIGVRAGDLIQDYGFLQEAGRPRSALAATPIFRNRPGYRRAYGVLRRIQDMSGLLVSGEELRVRFRSLSTLFEYWCFVQCAHALVASPRTAAPNALPEFELIDDVFRPELLPGQVLRFPLVEGGEVELVYEPEVPALRYARAQGRPWGATLGSGTLRPDVWIEVRREGARPRVLLLDAKSHARWETKQMFAVTDYRTRIVDTETYEQPVRQVWFMHRDLRSRPRSNIPGYLRDARRRDDAWILGALPCVPERTEALSRVIEIFLS